MKEPKIRFKEFKGEWEETTFGKISSNYKYGINAAAIPFDGTNKYLRITDIDEESRMFSKQDLTSPNADLSLCDDYLLEDGDITIARTGASVGKSYIYHKRDGKVYFAGFLIRMRLNKCTDKDCVYNITLTDKYSKHIRLVSQRSGQPGVNINELKDFSFFLPIDIPEQQSIASFFTTIDAQISASTSRLASLKQIKAASLQAMFPQEGETVPKLRFKGFEGEWEEITLGEIAPLVGGYAFKSANFEKTGIPIVRISNILDSGVVGGDFAKYKCFEGDTSFRLYDGDTVIAMSGATTGKVAVVKTQTFLYQNQRVGKFSRTDKIFYTFVSIFVGSKKFANALDRKLTASAQPNASSKDIDSIKLSFPSSKDEQQRIASYFTNLDRQITLQARRLEKLKQIKAACLDKMFV